MHYLETILSSILLLLTYAVYLAIYRVWFSPVANIPGPLLAKLTYWYEFYWDVIKAGQYTFHIRYLHDRYGPIIRLNPDEVHIDDPDYYDEVFTSSASNRKRNRWEYLMNAIGIDESTFSTIDHDLHRTRRAALNPFFSKAKIRALQGRLENIIKRLLTRMREFQDNQEPMSIGVAFTSITHDIISSYALDLKEFRVDALDFAPDFHIASQKLEGSIHLMKQFPWLLKLIQKTPVSIISFLDTEMGAYMRLQKDLQIKTEKIQTAHKQPGYEPPERTTILHELLDSKQIPEAEKSHARLWQDAESVIVAGTVTTAVTLSTLFFFLLSDTKRFRRLRDELFAAIPDKDAPVQLSQIENLPYLAACVREALRLSNGLASRIQRVDPEKDMIFHARTKSYGAPATRDTTYIIPPGTPVSMTQLLIHFNPRIYPKPYDFVPERWLEEDPATIGTDRIHHRLDKYYVPFSRGRRACLGINLAEAEIHLVLGMVFRRYGSKGCQMPGDEGFMELFDSSYERDIEIVADGFSPIVREPLKGIKVRIFPCDLTRGDNE